MECEINAAMNDKLKTNDIFVSAHPSSMLC